MSAWKTQLAEKSAVGLSSDPKPARTFIVPDEIVNQTIILDNGFVGLSGKRLPPELLMRIYELIGVPSFQVAFALSCKAAARVGRSMPLSPWRNLHDKRQLMLLLEKNWTSFQFCTACYMLRPQGEEYQIGKLQTCGDHGLPYNRKCFECCCICRHDGQEHMSYRYFAVWTTQDYEDLTKRQGRALPS